jgi:hypothetical protein
MPNKIKLFSDNSHVSKEICLLIPEIIGFNITIDQVLRAQDADPNVLKQRRPEIITITSQAIETVLMLSEPIIYIRNLEITHKDHKGIVIETNTRFSGQTVDRAFRPADYLLATIFTIGPEPEKEISRQFAQNPAYALAMDIAASQLVDLMGNFLCQAAEQYAEIAGEKTGVPVSPGEKDWDVLVGQPLVFSLFQEFDLSVSLNASGMMTPQKSMSMIIPMGKNLTESGKPCDFCSMNETCKFRVAS